MTTDKNKGITIIYNQLNLPQQIDFSNGARLINIYTADGTKIQSKFYSDISRQAVTTDYCGAFIYENNVLQQINIAGGRIVFENSTTKLNDYLYNGKELLKEGGLGWYEYGARYYDPVARLGFISIDPMAELLQYFTVLLCDE